MGFLRRLKQTLGGGTGISSGSDRRRVNTVLTIDDDFDRFDAFDTEVILSPDQFIELNRFLGN